MGSFRESFHESASNLVQGRDAERHSEVKPWCPRQDSNLRSRLRRAVLYPLSYGGRSDDNPSARPSPVAGPPRLRRSSSRCAQRCGVRPLPHLARLLPSSHGRPPLRSGHDLCEVTHPTRDSRPDRGGAVLTRTAPGLEDHDLRALRQVIAALACPPLRDQQPAPRTGDHPQPAHRSGDHRTTAAAASPHVPPAAASCTRSHSSATPASATRGCAPAAPTRGRPRTAA
jgi:hypothetical protein